jgi:eukaryotic-like serine/threonine-protein kinase
MNLLGARQGARSLTLLFAMVPLFIWNGIASWPTVIALVVCMALATLHAYESQKTRRFGLPYVFALLVPTAIVLDRFAGPFMILPPVITIFAMALMLQHSVNSRPILSIAALLVSLITPVILERFGVLDASWSIDGDRMIAHSTALEVNGRTTALLVVANAAFVVLAAMYSRGAAQALRNANRRLELQAWHLRQLLPATSSDRAPA